MTLVLELKTGDLIVPAAPFGDMAITNLFADPSVEAAEDVYVDVELAAWSHHQWDPDNLPAAAGAQDYGFLGLNPPRYRLRYGPADEVPIRFHHPDIGYRDGFVAANCGHALAFTEWRAGFRVCERCPTADVDGGS